MIPKVVPFRLLDLIAPIGWAECESLGALSRLASGHELQFTNSTLDCLNTFVTGADEPTSTRLGDTCR